MFLGVTSKRSSKHFLFTFFPVVKDLKMSNFLDLFIRKLLIVRKGGLKMTPVAAGVGLFSAAVDEVGAVVPGDHVAGDSRLKTKQEKAFVLPLGEALKNGKVISFLF
jgi:hypothetical protein